MTLNKSLPGLFVFIAAAFLALCVGCQKPQSDTTEKHVAETKVDDKKPIDYDDYFVPQFRVMMNECFESPYEGIPELKTEEEKNKYIEMAMNEIKSIAPDLFRATPDLVESFKNKTYDTQKCKDQIQKHVDLFKSYEVELPISTLVMIEKYENNSLDDQGLEFCKRTLDIPANKLKAELENYNIKQ